MRVKHFWFKAISWSVSQTRAKLDDLSCVNESQPLCQHESMPACFGPRTPYPPLPNVSSTATSISSTSPIPYSAPHFLSFRVFWTFLFSSAFILAISFSISHLQGFSKIPKAFCKDPVGCCGGGDGEGGNVVFCVGYDCSEIVTFLGRLRCEGCDVVVAAEISCGAVSGG